jgi:uncharacterized protein
MSRELTPEMKLTVTVGGDERRERQPLYREALKVLHEHGISGASLTKGVMSYGLSRRVHSALNEITMENLPVVIEAVAEQARAEAAAEEIAAMLGEHGLVQLQPTTVARRAPADHERQAPADDERGDANA